MTEQQAVELIKAVQVASDALWSIFFVLACLLGVTIGKICGSK